MFLTGILYVCQHSSLFEPLSSLLTEAELLARLVYTTKLSSDIAVMSSGFLCLPVLYRKWKIFNLHRRRH